MSNHSFWQAGKGGFVARERVVAIGRWSSAPLRRAAQQARQQGKLLDLTYGHACQWVLFLDSGHVVLATNQPPATTNHEVSDE